MKTMTLLYLAMVSGDECSFVAGPFTTIEDIRPEDYKISWYHESWKPAIVEQEIPVTVAHFLPRSQ
jgi:hypothetical protein